MYHKAKASDVIEWILEGETLDERQRRIQHFLENEGYLLSEPPRGVDRSEEGEDVPHSLDIWLHNPDQKDIWAAQNVGPTVAKSYEMTEGVAGTHYIQISDGQGSYTLEIK